MDSTNVYSALEANQEMSLLIEKVTPQDPDVAMSLRKAQDELRNSGKVAFLVALTSLVSEPGITKNPATLETLLTISSKLGQPLRAKSVSFVNPFPGFEESNYETEFKKRAIAILDRLKKSEEISLAEQALLYQYSVSGLFEDRDLAFRLLKAEIPSSQNMRQITQKVGMKLSEVLKRIEGGSLPENILEACFESEHVNSNEDRSSLLWAAGEFLDWESSNETPATLQEFSQMYTTIN